MEERKWDDLEMDCLVNILGRVGMESLLLDVPFVCKSWYKASLNPLCWGQLVFPNSELDSSCANSWCDDSFMDRLMDENGIMDKYEGKTFSITAFIKSIANRSCKNATKLFLPSFCTEEALKYVTDECPALKILGVCSELLYNYGHIIPELMGKWKNLEVLVLGSSNNLKEILTQISLHCKNFKEIHLEHDILDKEEASAIVNLLPNIKQLLLRRTSIDRESLMMILQGCKQLVHLDVSNCVGFEADDKILELTSHIQTFKYEGSRLTDYYYDSGSNYDNDYESDDRDDAIWGRLSDSDDGAPWGGLSDFDKDYERFSENYDDDNDDDEDYWGINNIN